MDKNGKLSQDTLVTLLHLYISSKLGRVATDFDKLNYILNYVSETEGITEDNIRALLNKSEKIKKSKLCRAFIKSIDDN